MTTFLNKTMSGYASETLAEVTAPGLWLFAGSETVCYSLRISTVAKPCGVNGVMMKLRLYMAKRFPHVV